LSADLHLDHGRLADLVAERGRLAAEESAHLAGCSRCRTRLVAADPTLLLTALGALPTSDPVPPRLPAERFSPRGRAAPRRRSRGLTAGRGLALAAAAAGLAAVALLVPRPDAAGRPGNDIVRGEARPGYSDVVRRIDSETAVVLTLLPDDPGGIPVTMIIDEELEL